MSNTPSAAFSDTKAHYDLLDGLRGVAALMVIWYHIFEGYAFASDTMITTFNHGYLSFQVSLLAMPMMTAGVRVLQ